MDDRQYLYMANVGSHVWGMARPESDIDYFAVYQAPSVDILLGRRINESRHSIVGLDDVQQHEIGRVVGSLLQGNFNFLVGIFSPLTLKPWTQIDVLREMRSTYLSKQCYKSIHGIGVDNYNKYIASGKETGAKAQKRMNTICRSLGFGITLLRTGEFKFEPYWDATKERVVELLKELDDAHANSILPDAPLRPEKLENWLLDMRVQSLRDDHHPVCRGIV